MYKNDRFFEAPTIFYLAKEEIYSRKIVLLVCKIKEREFQNFLCYFLQSFFTHPVFLNMLQILYPHSLQ